MWPAAPRIAGKAEVVVYEMNVGVTDATVLDLDPPRAKERAAPSAKRPLQAKEGVQPDEWAAPFSLRRQPEGERRINGSVRGA